MAKGIEILVVSNDPADKLIKELEQKEYTVRTAKYSNVLREIRTHKTDKIILWNPCGYANRIYTTIKANEISKNIPIVVLTNKNELEEEDKKTFQSDDIIFIKIPYPSANGIFPEMLNYLEKGGKKEPEKKVTTSLPQPESREHPDNLP
jgi:CheY-like chemotaxis protein